MDIHPVRDGGHSDIAGGGVLKIQVWISSVVKYSHYFNYGYVLSHFQRDAQSELVLSN